MKIAGFFLVALSLIIGILGAVTAYLPLTRLPDEQLLGLTLNAPAGAVRDDENKLEPLVAKDATLTDEVLKQLREAGVKRVRVKEFGFRRWTGSGLFLLGSAGLLIGGLILRHESRRIVPAVEGEPDAVAPEELLRTIREQLGLLQSELRAGATDEQRREALLLRLGGLQRNEAALFTGARTALVRRLGMGGYARLMDRFSAGERQVNRAWSAGADGVIEEAVECVGRAEPLFAEAEKLLGEG